ncbi:MAG: sulfite exporter TauE/SafE family protein [Candidatus Nitrospinota bacterium M3_3B_026]
MTAQITLAVLVVFAAGLIQGLTGFGAGMVAVPLLTLLLGVKKAIPLVALVALALLVFMTVKTWRDMDGGRILRLAAGALPGIPLGLYILVSHDETIIRLILGFILVVYSLFALFAKDLEVAMNERAGYVFGFLSGFFSGAINTGGPPVVIYGSLRGWGGDSFKATLTGFFIINQVIIVAAHAMAGVSSMKTVSWFLILAPFVALGAFSGAALYDRVDQESFRKIVHALLLAVGFVMVFS